MMPLSKLYTAVLLLLLTGCASAPQTVQYYLLNTPSASSNEAAELPSESGASVLIEPVEFPDFLRQPGLVLQQGNNRIHMSKVHLWAEPLDKALPKLLQQSLQGKFATVAIKTLDDVTTLDHRVRLRIDSLQATDSGDVIAAGRYQLTGKDQQTTFHDFYFSQALERDGHRHAVEVIQLLVDRIAGDIAQKLAGTVSASIPESAP